MDWSAIWLEYHRSILIYIYSQTRDWSLAEDLASDTFFRALRADCEGNGPQSNIRSWLYRIARNLMIDHFKYRARHKVTQIEEVDEQLPISDYASLEEYAANADLLRRVEQVAKGLSDFGQAVVVLRYEGYAFEEIGEMLGRTEGACKSSQHQAFAHIRKSVRV